MKVYIEPVREVSLEEFADQYGLELVVTERVSPGLPKWYARIKNLDVKEGSCLASCCGNGETIEEAVREFIAQLSGKCAVIDAGTGARVDVMVPKLSSDMSFLLREKV